MKVKHHDGYYEQTRTTDAVINERSQQSNFHKFAKGFTPRLADVKRSEQYEKFFNNYKHEADIDIATIGNNG